jgi:hypothetical protein
MRRVVFFMIAFLSAAAALPAQDAQKVLDTFKRNFAIASLDVKIQILQDAATTTTAASMGALFLQAIDFVVDNASLIPTDMRFNQLASIAAEQAGIAGYAPARYSLWNLFKVTTDSQTLAKAAIALGTAGAGDAEIVADFNRYVDAQDTLFSSGKSPDTVVIAACFQAMGKLGDPSSFPVLFSAMNAGYSDSVATLARNALLSIKGDLAVMLRGVIKERPLAEKKLALQMALDSGKLTDEQKSQISEYSLDISLHTSAVDVATKAIMRDIRFLAAANLGSRNYAHATGLMIEHLDMTIGEFDKGIVDRNHLLDTIGNLGAMNTHEAAVRLTQFLVLINSYTEKGKAYDDQVVYAVIQNLGALADKVAFDDLMYTQYLTYSAGVKKAARTALDKLKW